MSIRDCAQFSLNRGLLFALGSRNHTATAVLITLLILPASVLAAGSPAPAVPTANTGSARSDAQALVTVTGAFARPTVPGQAVGGAFMTLTSKQTETLIAVSSPAAAMAQVHKMTMTGTMMTMAPVDALLLPANTPVQLAPGGLHIMLMDLKAPLENGKSISLVLRFRDRAGATVDQTVIVPVTMTAPGR